MWVGDAGNHPVVLAADPELEPTSRGRSYYHTTPSGQTIVHHPNAYGYRTLYHASTLRIEVGAAWLLRHPITRVRVAGIMAWVLSAEIEEIHGLRVSRGWHRSGRITLVEGAHEEYHAQGWDSRAAIREALSVWRRRREEAQRDQQITQQLDRIWVSAEDSVAAGNCPYGTSVVVHELATRLGGDRETILGAVRADYLLAYRRDAYTLRAVRQAARRILA